jgi:hypothetical protein
MSGTAEYETHVTVDLANATQMPRLRNWADAEGLKCTHIVLDCGRSPSQPMLTWHGRGSLGEQQAAAEATCCALAAAGFAVSRVKIEAAPWNPEVPISAAEASDQRPGRYFEHHVKLHLGRAEDRQLLVRTAIRHRAHLSRNALKLTLEDGEERFVTQRCTMVGRAEARQQLNLLVDDLRALGHRILDIEEEFVVYDSNLDLDAGWMLSPD